MAELIHSNTLIDVASLAAALKQTDLNQQDLNQENHDQWLRIIDTRFSLADPSAGQQQWQAGHIPGAVYLDLDHDLSDHRKPATQGRHPLPEQAAFIDRLNALNITPQQQIVIYDSADGSMAAARCWWLLQLLGHRRSAVLDGGIAAWRAQHLPESSDSATPIVTSSHTANWQNAQFDSTMMISTAALNAALANKTICLLDARAAERYRGEVEPIDRIAGHIPGALNRPFTLNLIDGFFKSSQQLRKEFTEQLGEFSPSQLVLSCGSGVTACHHALALAHAGFTGARLYAPSWSGWIAQESSITQ